MYLDIISFKKTQKTEELAKSLHLTLLSLEELKPLRIIEGKNDALIRKVLELNQTDILLNPHQGRPKDSLHSRNSGLNHILCAFAAKHNITIAVSLDACYESKDLAKIMQNIKLCRKYNVNFIFLTLAKNPYELRNPQDIISFCKILGMTPKEAINAVTSLADLLKRKNIKYS